MNSAPTHRHLWMLPDGTGLHAPPGRIAYDDTGRLCCHLCGRWFVALGAHVRVHGYSAASYREALGLRRTAPLSAETLSDSISARQKNAYEGSAAFRARLATGQDLARSGALTAILRSRAAPDRPEAAVVRQEQLRAGRATLAAQRQQRLAQRLIELGATDLHEYLRSAYRDGASLEELSASTGLGRQRLGDAVEEAGIIIRPPGHNTARGKRSRARTAELEAAQRIGIGDLRAWLSQRRAAGWTLTDLASAVGHSTHWVTRRLADSPSGEGCPRQA